MDTMSFAINMIAFHRGPCLLYGIPFSSVSGTVACLILGGVLVLSASRCHICESAMLGCALLRHLCSTPVGAPKFCF